MEAEVNYILPYRLLCDLLATPPLITESYKLQPGSAKINRYFIHLDETARPLVKQELDALGGSLQLPEEALAFIRQQVTNLDITFIGVDEEDGTCTYKMYLGFAKLMEPEAGKQAFSVEWVPGEKKHAVKEYAYEKEVNEAQALAQAKASLASSVFEKDAGGEKLYELCREMIGNTHFTSDFLSVKQHDAARQSVYFSLVEGEPLLFEDLRVVITLTAALLDVPSDAMGWLNNLCNGAVLEHLSVGVNNSLLPFITFYRNPVNTVPVYDTGEKTAGCLTCRNVRPSEEIKTQFLNTNSMENQELQFNAAETLPALPSTNELMSNVAPSFAETPAISPSCSCAQGDNAAASSSSTGRNKGELVFALGSIGYQFGNESIRRSIEGEVGPITGNPELFLNSLLGQDPGGRNKLYLADSILWTFNLDGFPIYTIRPEGNFAKETYETLIRFMLYSNTVQTSVNTTGFSNAVRCTLSGITNGTIKLMNGMEVPVVNPDLRGLFCWTIDELIKELAGPTPAAKATAAEKDTYTGVMSGVLNFMERVYYSLRNTGKNAHDRAINYAVTNAFLVHKIFSQGYTQKLALKTITAQKSIFGLPGADCWDVVLTFFNPMNQMGEANTIYTFTVDVSSSVPSLIGPVRSWQA